MPEPEYDPIDDSWKSVYEAYRLIREGVAEGEPGWVPKVPPQQEPNPETN